MYTRTPCAAQVVAPRLTIRLANNCRYALDRVTASMRCQLHNPPASMPVPQVALPLMNDCNATLQSGTHWVLVHVIDAASPLARAAELDRDGDGVVTPNELRRVYEHITWIDVMLSAQDRVYNQEVHFRATHGALPHRLHLPLGALLRVRAPCVAHQVHFIHRYYLNDIVGEALWVDIRPPNTVHHPNTVPTHTVHLLSVQHC